MYLQYNVTNVKITSKVSFQKPIFNLHSCSKFKIHLSAYKYHHFHFKNNKHKKILLYFRIKVKFYLKIYILISQTSAWHCTLHKVFIFLSMLFMLKPLTCPMTSFFMRIKFVIFFHARKFDDLANLLLSLHNEVIMIVHSIVYVRIINS